jgi:acyl carrier protein
MIPNHFVQLESFPLTINGKVDKKKLLNLNGKMATGNKYVAPATEIEKELVDLWQELLNKEQIGTDDNFFDIGGHSLKGTQLISRVYRDYQVRIPLRNLFNKPTIKTMAEEIELLLSIQQSNQLNERVIENEIDEITL